MCVGSSWPVRAIEHSWQVTISPSSHAWSRSRAWNRAAVAGSAGVCWTLSGTRRGGGRGFALGGGCEVALSCHLRIASDNAIFASSEIGLAVIPG
ncbi:MAG: enoyl-CoA hydratase-related protein [Gemmatimonadota bacterium]|nr:enoyl-CoA hydratase-related protein [Gemmatimonadota bacterium]